MRERQFNSVYKSTTVFASVGSPPIFHPLLFPILLSPSAPKLSLDCCISAAIRSKSTPFLGSGAPTHLPSSSLQKLPFFCSFTVLGCSLCHLWERFSYSGATGIGEEENWRSLLATADVELIYSICGVRYYFRVRPGSSSRGRSQGHRQMSMERSPCGLELLLAIVILRSTGRCSDRV